MKVKDVMHRGVTCVRPDTSVRTLAKCMRDDDIGAVAVQVDGKLLGIVTDRDVTCRALANGKDVAKMTAADVMSRRVVSCRADDDIKAAIVKMEAKKIRRLPVLNSHKAMVGMLSIGDISHAASRQMSGEVLRTVSGHHT